MINNGDGPAETFFIVISNQAGEQLETITRRATDSQPLVPGGTEILTSLQPHSGVITITVLVGGDIAERNLGDERNDAGDTRLSNRFFRFLCLIIAKYSAST